MTNTTVFAIALGIGIIAGLRSLTAPAAVSWAAHLQWIGISRSSLAFLGSPIAAYILLAAAVLEFVVDKLPKTPARTKPPSLLFRLITGGLSGAALAAAGHQSPVVGGILGAVGAIIGAFLGYQARSRAARASKMPAILIALGEDAIAIAGALFLTSRFII